MKPALKTLVTLLPAGLAVIVATSGCTYDPGYLRAPAAYTSLYQPYGYPYYGYSGYYAPPFYYDPYFIGVPRTHPPARRLPDAKPPAERPERNRTSSYDRLGDRSGRHDGSRSRSSRAEHHGWKRPSDTERHRPEGIRPRSRAEPSSAPPRFTRGDDHSRRMGPGSDRSSSSTRESRRQRSATD